MWLVFSVSTSVVTVIAADIATAVDSFHRITTANAVAIDVFDGRCSVGTPLTTLQLQPGTWSTANVCRAWCNLWLQLGRPRTSRLSDWQCSRTLVEIRTSISRWPILLADYYPSHAEVSWVWTSVGPKCLGSEVSWVRSVCTPVTHLQLFS